MSDIGPHNSHQNHKQVSPILKEIAVDKCTSVCYTKEQHHIRKDLPHTVYDCLSRCSEKMSASWIHYINAFNLQTQDRNIS